MNDIEKNRNPMKTRCLYVLMIFSEYVQFMARVDFQRVLAIPVSPGNGWPLAVTRYGYPTIRNDIPHTMGIYYNLSPYDIDHPELASHNPTNSTMAHILISLVYTYVILYTLNTNKYQ